ncbi:MAG: matrixin family metalloprotease [Cyanobacteria bacterium]|nr:matrixin family metalloprotease [Cyanobacteriota bacterium]
MSISITLTVSTPSTEGQSSWQAGGNDSGGSDSLQVEIEKVESDLGLKPTAQQSLIERVGSIEYKLFGPPQSDPDDQSGRPLMDRLARIRAAVSVTNGEKKNQAPTGPIQSAELATTASGKNRSSGEARAESSPAQATRAHVDRLITALPLVNLIPPRFYRIEPPNQAKESDDYIREVLAATQNRVMRFKGMPVPVYVTPYKEARYTRACIQGFENWEARSKGMIRFVQVADPRLARIRVIWSQLGLGTDDNDCALGAHTVTKWKRNSSANPLLMSLGVPVSIPGMGKKYQVPPQVIEVNTDLIDSKREDIRFITLKNIVTHELGHALGLLGHSLQRADMMYAVTDENSRLSQRDINTIKRLYEMGVDIPL